MHLGWVDESGIQAAKLLLTFGVVLSAGPRGGSTLSVRPVRAGALRHRLMPALARAEEGEDWAQEAPLPFPTAQVLKGCRRGVRTI